MTSLEKSTSTLRKASPLAMGAFALGALLAFIIYRPDRQLPFDILDFSEFLPILQTNESFWGRSGALIEYYAGHGRANLLPYLGLSAKWSLFGEWSPGWQWSRFLAMLGILFLTYQLLRRLGASTLGALAGSSVFLVAPAAAGGWIRLTMAEPLGTLLLLGMCLTIIPSRRLRRTRSGWILVGTLALSILLTKEMLVATFLLPLMLLAQTTDDGRLTRPSFSSTSVRFILVMSVIGFVCLAPMAVLHAKANPDAFTAQFGTNTRSAGDTVAAWLATLTPVDPRYGFPSRFMGGALILMLALALGGWWVQRRDSAGSNSFGLLLTAIVFPLVGAIIYIPWPAYQQFYAIPFLPGTSILFGFALSGLERHAPRSLAAAAYGWWALVLLVAGTEAHRQAGRAAVLQKANDRVIARVALLTSVDSVLVPSDRRAPQAWQGLGATLGRYAAARGHPWPPAVDVPCEGTEIAAGRPNIAILYYSSLCPHGEASAPIVEKFRRFSLRNLSLLEDSIRIDVVVRP